ncbi:hypothetical protein [Providencia stuartii]|uniref:hypothetical protein n=1 Tax=Providencia stuartii TaxID=588 RepID=UPI001495315F|nr:hypothetical protein [Providencia stuartii]NPD40704.1 hypothetical protein [Providencia stuartii]NPD94336.1 hypothetical protein [Providencia stuartii]
MTLYSGLSDNYEIHGLFNGSYICLIPFSQLYITNNKKALLEKQEVPLKTLH